MASDKVKGISIEISAETKNFTQALKDLKKESSSLQNELRYVDKALKLDPTNVDLVKQKEELLAKQITAVEENVKKLKEAKERADKDMQNGTEVNEEEYRRLVREISAAEQQLASTRREADKFANACEKAGGKMVEIGKKGMVASAAIIGGLTASAEGTREYREDINRLKTAFETTGKSAEVAKSTYLGFYTVLGETDRSVEAVNHLAKLCDTEQDLAKWTDICAGVSATFTDSLAIEGLTESANETAKVGKVTGQLADALKWVGINEDKFNEKLEACNSEQERSQLITSTLADAYMEAANSFKGNNAQVIKSREEHQKLTDATARLGAIVEPQITKVISAVTKLTEWFLKLDDNTQKAAVSLIATSAALPPLVIGIGQTITAVGKIKTAVTALKLAAMPVSVSAIAAAAVGLAAVVYALSKQTDKETEAVRRLRKESEKRTAEINDRIKQYGELKKASEDAAAANMSEMHYIEGLREELGKLVNANGKVEDANRARVEFILGQLNDALGTEYKLTGDQIDKYGDLCNSIDEVIDKRKAEIILAAMEEPYKKAVQNIETSKKAMDSASAAYDNAKKAYDDYVKELDGSEEILTAWQVHHRDELELTMKTTKKELKEASKEYENYTNDIKKYEDLETEYHEKGAQAFVETWEKKIGIAKETAKKAGEAAVEGLKEAALESAFETIGNNAMDGFIKGINNKDPFLQETMRRIANNVPQVFKNILQINSPAKVMIPPGEAIPEGIAVGVKNKEKELLTAVQKQAETLGELYNSKIKAYANLIAVSVAKLEIWQYQEPSAPLVEAAKNNLDVLKYKESFQNEITYEADMQRQRMKEAYGENSDMWIEAELEYYKQYQSLAKIQKEVFEAQTELTLYKAGKKYNQDAFDLAANKYELWEMENPAATEDEKLSRKKEMLTEQYHEQGKKVAELNDKLYDEIQRTGETSEASVKLENQLIKEKIAYEELAKAIAEVSESRAASSSGSFGRTAAQDYTAYKIAYAQGLKSVGYSDEDIDRVARKVSGYKSGVTVVNNNYGITEGSAYEVRKGTEQSLEKLAMQGVL